MPFACQIVRRTTGTAGTGPEYGQGPNSTPPQVSPPYAAKKPELPKLMSSHAGQLRASQPAPGRFGLPLRPGCGAGAPVPAERQTDGKEA